MKTEAQTQIMLFLGEPLHLQWRPVPRGDDVIFVIGSSMMLWTPNFYVRPPSIRSEEYRRLRIKFRHARCLNQIFIPPGIEKFDVFIEQELLSCMPPLPPNFALFDCDSFLPAADWWDDHGDEAAAELCRQWATNAEPLLDKPTFTSRPYESWRFHQQRGELPYVELGKFSS